VTSVPTPLRGFYDTFGVWLAHCVRPDDGTCDRCGDRRETGYFRWEVYTLRQCLCPEICRYCFDCMVELKFDTATGADDAQA
jgi:hypothetical protein